MTVKGLLFDFDGTLGDTTALILNSFHATLNHFGQRQVEDRDIIATFGLPLAEGLKALMPTVAEEQAVTYYHSNNVSNHDALIKPFPYVSQGLEQLKTAGYQMAVVTSKKNYLAHRGLDILNLSQYMSAVITSEDCIEHKPLAEPMERGAQALGLSPHECVCLGDSPFDMLSGKAAGCITVLVNWTPYEDDQIEKLVVPDYRIDKMTDLLPLLQSIR